MKKLCSFIFLFLLVWGAQSQVLIKDENAVARDVAGPFQGIRVSGVIDLILAQGDEVALAVSAETASQREDIITEVKDGVLDIHLRSYGMRSKHSSGKMRVYISFKKLDKIDASGACDIVLQEKVKATQLKLMLSGACSFSGNVEVAELKTQLSGACNVHLKESSIEKMDASLSGASSIKSLETVVQSADINCSGACIVKLSVEKELKAHASGACVISYKGNPQILQKSLSGVSSLKKVD